MNCPICNGELSPQKTTYSYYDIVFGDYDAEVCSTCNEVFFTQEASDAIDRRAKELGLWGLEQRSRISYSGNSMIVRIPKRIAGFLNLEKGTEIIVHPEGKRRLVIEIPE